VCNGCCESEQDAKEKMFATACGIDLLMASDVENPSQDDWGSCGEACGCESLGMLCHDMLGQSVADSLPTWGSMRPPNERRGAAEGADQFRVKLQKKAYRTKCVLNNNRKRLRIQLLCFFGVMVERLMSTLTYMDSQTKGLFDMIFQNGLNPIYVCRTRLSKLVKEGLDGPLGVLFDYYAPDLHFELLTEARAMGINFSTQVPSRFCRFS